MEDLEWRDSVLFHELYRNQSTGKYGVFYTSYDGQRKLVSKWFRHEIIAEKIMFDLACGEWPDLVIKVSVINLIKWHIKKKIKHIFANKIF